MPPKPRVEKPPVRTPEVRNLLIAPLLEPGNDWVESFVRRKYKWYQDDETIEELTSIGYSALIEAADRWIPRSLLKQKNKPNPIDLIDLYTSSSDEIRLYLGGEGFFIYAQNHLRSKMGEHIRGKGLPFHVSRSFTEKEDYERPHVLDLDNPDILGHDAGMVGISDWKLFKEVKTAEEELIARQNSEQLAAAMKMCLTAKERYIVSRRNGLLGHHPGTLEEIGEELGVTRQNIHQIYPKALAKLRKELGEEF